jgi:hypothetical protein
VTSDWLGACFSGRGMGVRCYVLLWGAWSSAFGGKVELLVIQHVWAPGRVVSCLWAVLYLCVFPPPPESGLATVALSGVIPAPVEALEWPVWAALSSIPALCIYESA